MDCAAVVGWLGAFVLGVFVGAGAFVAGHEYDRLIAPRLRRWFR